MSWLIVTPEQNTELNAINATQSGKDCTALATVDGVLVTNADKIGDVYWSAYQDFLATLSPFDGEPIWPASQNNNTDELIPTEEPNT